MFYPGDVKILPFNKRKFVWSSSKLLHLLQLNTVLSWWERSERCASD